MKSFAMPTLLAMSLNAFFTGALPMAELMDNPPPQERVFKTTGARDLKLFYFTPPDWKASERRTAVVWIHGGGWTAGTADVFYPAARYFASRGAVGFSISYRLVTHNGATVGDCIEDCKSAIRFIRTHAAELGIDPQRVVSAGDSAGGHLAACLGTLDGFDAAGDDLKISARADVMVLFNPIVDMTAGDWLRSAVGGKYLTDKKLPVPPSPENLALARSLSPLFHVHSNQPPTLLMHGLGDAIVSPAQARQFAATMTAAGNRCDLVLLEHARHAFVVPRYRATEPAVVVVMRQMDQFLISLKLLTGEPTLQVSKTPAWIPLGAPMNDMPKK